MKEKIYAIVHRERPVAYIGRTYQSLENRWKQHLRSAADGEVKTLFEELRHDPQGFDILLCEESETASEAEWMAKFEADGYTLLNETGGNAKPPKQRDTVKERELRELLAGKTEATTTGLENWQICDTEGHRRISAYLKKQHDEWIAAHTV